MRVAAALLALSYLAFISLGLPDTVIGVAWPTIRGTFGVSPAGLGVVLLAGICGYVLSGLVAGRMVGALGVGGLLAASSGLVAVALVGYALAPTWGLFIAVAPFVGMGSGAIDSALNAYAARHFPVRHVNWLHACWSLGATAGPAWMTAVLARGWPYGAGYAGLAAVLGALALAFAATRRAWSDGPVGLPTPDEPETVTVGAALRRGRVWLQIAVFFVYTGLEAGAGQWSFSVLREARGLSIEAAGAWTSAFWGSLALSRVALGFVVDRVGPDRLLRLATLAAVAGATTFALSAAPPGRIGLLVLGASLAPMYPTLMARTPGRLGHATTAHAVGFQVAAATIGSAVVPGAFGLVAARHGAGAVALAVAGVSAVLLLLHEMLLGCTPPGRVPPVART
jgi:fucose permease